MFSLLRKVIPVFVTGVLVLSLIACSPSPKAADEEGIVIVIAEDPPSFNPAIADTGYDYLVMELVMLGLADVDPQGNIFPELGAGRLHDPRPWRHTSEFIHAAHPLVCDGRSPVCDFGLSI